MLTVENITIFSADRKGGLVDIEGEAVFEGRIELPFFASFYQDDEEFDEIELEDDFISSFDEDDLKKGIMKAYKDYIEE